MDKKIGVYICTGCAIGDSLDVEKLTSVASSEMKAPVCRVNPAFCLEEGINIIKGDIQNEGVNTIVIAACSPRVNYDVFSFNSSTILERVNLREQVVWSHAPKDEDTQMLAEDCLRMGITRANIVEPLVPFKETIDKTILVVGGGLCGLTAALESAKAGYEVVLVEKEESLGGWMTRVWKQIPTAPPYTEIEEPTINSLISEVKNNPKIKVRTSTEIEQISGAPGMFDVTLKNGDAFRAGAIVLATGAKPYNAARLENLGYDKYPDVITGAVLEEMAIKGNITRPSNGGNIKNVVFIQCAGSRDPAHLPYCSSECCLTSLKQAKYIRKQIPDAKVFIVYKDIRTPGKYELFYKKIQEDEGIFLTKGEISGVSQNGDGLIVEAENTLLGEKIHLKADLVVLATGMVPTTFVEPIPEEEKKKDEKILTADGKKEAEAAELGAKILNLTYRQGTDLPTLKYGFPDSHYICFPYETRRTGIYAAGCVRQPMDAAAAADDAAGAALKAIQCVELTARGAAVHPRAGDMSYPDFFLQKCTQCKRCTEECPFGTLDEDEKGTPKPNPTRCRRCGVCMGACPERIVSFKDYSVHIVSSMIKAIEVPEEEEEKPRVLALVCENDAYPALDMAGLNRLNYTPFMRFIPVRCLGSFNVVWIADALSKGIDGIILIGCKYGDDYQCHFIKGSELANKRGENIQEALQRLVLEPERIEFVQLAISEYNRLPDILNGFMEKITEVGPNPYKGM
ncbi:MAG: FAD-dependent oxidoreductase [bacterium]